MPIYRGLLTYLFRRWNTFLKSRENRSMRENDCGRDWRRPRAGWRSRAVRNASWRTSLWTRIRRRDSSTSLSRWRWTHEVDLRDAQPSRSRLLERCPCYTRSALSLDRFRIRRIRILNQAVNQSIHPSIDRSINQSISQSVSQSDNQTIRQSISQSNYR